MRRTHTTVDSPIGPLTLMAVDSVLCGLYMVEQRHPPRDEAYGVRDDTAFDGWVAQLREYFDGGRTEFDLPVQMFGTAFQRQVWAALREIAYGETATYRELAERIGRPTAARAVGLANGHNPISIVVPCHRVVGTGGGLTGYGGGLDRKRFLLDLESTDARPSDRLG
jgi:methylated-DNA-[protein]-cysteine S-methyltransferase